MDHIFVLLPTNHLCFIYTHTGPDIYTHTGPDWYNALGFYQSKPLGTKYMYQTKIHV